jgi:hypothetical protein
MGIFDYSRKRPPTQAKFAKMLLKRIRASGDKRPVQFDSHKFIEQFFMTFCAFCGKSKTTRGTFLPGS